MRRILIRLLLLFLGAGLGFLALYAFVLDRQIQREFVPRWDGVPTTVLARPLELRPGMVMNLDSLRLELDAAGYREQAGAATAGSYAVSGQDVLVHSRGFDYLDGPEPRRRLRVTLADGRVRGLAELPSESRVARARLDPARIATLYGARKEERRPLRLKEVPALLVTTLQAVEDRDFKHHLGIDFSGMARAAFANLRAGRISQGGSTLTQQLVRTRFLSRERSFLRKGREIMMSVLLEARFSKHLILEAYLNDVYLGQNGAAPVHGVASAAQFYFGREVEALAIHEIALLVGLVRGPSWYDPRRNPERALERRNRVLGQMQETGLIGADAHARAVAQPLGVLDVPRQPRNRYPAFLDLVREQIEGQYTASDLAGTGLVIHTTFSPSDQAHAMAALDEGLAELGERAESVQAAAVLTDADTGEVLSLVGARDASSSGFNRALDAARPIGSLVKPFVYLEALSQPQRWSLASVLEDAPVLLTLDNGQRWMPSNFDKRAHGRVLLLDALARSYNLASVRLGLELGVPSVARRLQSLTDSAPVAAHPSLLLGAVELSPLQVAQGYQFLASGGRALRLRAVRGVMSASGEVLARYHAPSTRSADSTAAELVSFALGEAARSGTASGLQRRGLGWLAIAGKTGTSNDQRDSWFAGYTADRLGVVWLGRDDNRATELTGSSGALTVFAHWFRRLPTEPRVIGGDALVETLHVDPESGAWTDASCPGARELPFARGYEPSDHKSCRMEKFKSWFREG